uniref:Uncharacterized protein n=1 Tax=Avena sativa TaxID=4498 RepID=A0ACD5WFW8_AVESA
MRNQRLPPTTCSSSNNNTMQEDQPHLSGAYIRRLVKHLSSSSTRRSRDHHHHTIITMGTNPHVQPQQQEQQAAPQTPKKQVRRRLHTSRPYQERLLNMAEARREIVTALKIHRASMRQAKEQQQQQQLVQQQQEVQVVQEQISWQAAWSAPMGSYGLSLSDYLHDSSPSAELTATSSSCSYYSSPILPYHTPPVAAPLVPMVDGPLDHFLSLPAQPLGLNLSFHGFGGAAAAGEDDKSDPTGSFHPPPLLQPSPASSYSVYSSPPPATTMASGPSHDVSSTVTSAAENTSLHRVLDDEEMAAICSAGEQHDIEWSDTVNLVTSAWWSTLLERVEGSGAGAAVAQQTNAGDAPLGMHRSDEYYGPDDSFQLPRMDIGEMDGWDAEWFS